MAVEAVVLAAGRSTRTGTFKPTLPLLGKTIIENCIEPMYDLCSRIIVVVGHRKDEIIRVLQSYGKVQMVFNADYEGEMLVSVKLGIRHVTEDRFFIVPADYPFIRKTTYQRLLEASGDIVIPTFYGQSGHPVLFNSYHIPGILIVNEEHYSLRDYIQRAGAMRVEVNDPGIRFDIDTANDYRRALALTETGKRVRL
ncbi:MAG: nucleotidyltransferase family protein [Bacillota bacterium]